MKSSAITTAQFKLGTALLPLLVKGITEEHTMVRPGDIGNSINFIVGHVTATRFSLARTIGLDAQFEWAPLYSRGAKVDPSGKYPSLGEVLDVWQRISVKLEERLDNMTEDDLSTESAVEYPGMEKTIRGAIGFLAFHESYHLGQLQYLRRLLGYNPLFG